MIAEDGIYMLNIKKVDRSWKGILVCEAENALGTARTVSTIHVQGIVSFRIHHIVRS